MCLTFLADDRALELVVASMSFAGIALALPYFD